MLLAVLQLVAAASLAPAQHDVGDFREFVALTCLDCHAGAEAAGGADLAAALEDPAGARALWEVAYERVQARSMPPEAPLNRDERAEWIAGAAALVGDVPAPAATVRRLTRTQLGRVLAELVGAEVPVERYLARDASSYGFDTGGDTLFVTPLAFESLFEVVDVALAAGRAAGTADVFDATEPVEERLARFVERAFRRPPTAAEIGERLRLVRELRAGGVPDEEALDAALRATLLAPAFLYRNELGASGGPHDVAARLALFLWGTLPDDALVARARSGALAEPGVVLAEARRMLQDERARWLAEDFALQWLGVTELVDVTPDVRRFSAFNEGLRRSMRAEVVAFFAALVTENRSVLECLDSDSVFVDARLAKHYGLEGVEGGRVRRVARGERTERGGVLGMAAIHTVTSEPLRTSPVRRGQWILERLLRSPAPPPPPNAGRLPEDDQQEDGLTLAARLAQHRADPTCAACHARMDPFGLALEAFDGIGRLRPDLDSSAVLPGGTEVRGPAELKAALGSDPQRFVRAFVDHVFIYAVGRPPGLADHAALEEIVERAEASGYRVQDIVLGVVATRAFRGATER